MQNTIARQLLEKRGGTLMVQDSDDPKINAFIREMRRLSPQVTVNANTTVLPDNVVRLNMEVRIHADEPWIASAIQENVEKCGLKINIVTPNAS